MKIGLIDVDGHNFPNIALMKISAYHKAQGHDVEWWNGFLHYDVVYKSRVFTNEYTRDIEYAINADKVIAGGTGYDLKNRLTAEIENCCPDYSIYPNYPEAYGYLTRGCPRNCPFCIVTQKEGRKSLQVADVSDFYRGQGEIKLLDPNILACSEHERILEQLARTGAGVDFTQGLDIRLTTQDNIKLLNTVKTVRLHFAWDNPAEDLTMAFQRFAELTKVKDYRRRIVYILTNFNTTHEQDLWRVNTVRELGYNPYVMIYDKNNAPRITRHLARWANNYRIFRKIKDFKNYNPAKG